MIRDAGCFFLIGRSFTNITTDVGGCVVNGKDGQVLIHKESVVRARSCRFSLVHMADCDHGNSASDT